MAVSAGTLEAVIELRDKMSKQLKTAARNLKTTGEKMKKVGTMARQAGTELTMGLTLPIVAVAAVATKSFLTFEKSMNRVAAVTGATGGDFVKLTKTAEELGRTTQFSATQAAEAMGFFGLAGFNTTEIIKAMPATLNLAAAGQLEMSAAADIAAKVMRGYGMEAEELEGAIDVLTKAFTSANTDLTQLGQAFKYAGPVAKSAGVEFEETVAALSLMADAGFQATMGGTALRGAIARLLNPTKAMRRVMDDLNLTVVDSNGRLLSLDAIVQQLEPHSQRTGEILELFGLRAGPAMAALIDRGSDALRNLTGELRDSAGTAERIQKIQMRGLFGAWMKLKSAWEGVSISLGRHLAPSMHAIADSLKNLATWITMKALPAWKTLDDTWKTLILTVVAMTASVGPLLLVLGTLTIALGALATALGTTALAATGWGLVAAAAALAIIYLYRETETGRKIINGLWKAIKETAKILGNYFTEAIGKARFALHHLWIITKNIGDAFVWLRGGNKKLGDEVDKVTESVDAEAEAIEELIAQKKLWRAVLNNVAPGLGSVTIEIEELTEAETELDQYLKTNIALFMEMRKASTDLASAVEVAAAATMTLDERIAMYGIPRARQLTEILDGAAYASENFTMSLYDAQQALEGVTMVAGASRVQLDAMIQGWRDTNFILSDAEIAFNKLEDRQKTLFLTLKNGVIPEVEEFVEVLTLQKGIIGYTSEELEKNIALLVAGAQKYKAMGEAVPLEHMERFLEQLQMLGGLKEGVLIPIDIRTPDWKELMFQQQESINATNIKLGFPVVAMDPFEPGIKAMDPIVFKGDAVPGFSIGQNAGKGISEGLKQILAGVPAMITQSLIGGGDAEGVYRAIGSQIGALIGQQLAKAMGVGELGQQVGAGLGAMVGTFVKEAVSVIGRFFENLTSGGNRASAWVTPIIKGFKEIADAGMAAGGIISGEFLDALQMAKGWAQGNVDAMAHFKEQTEATAVALASLFAPLTNEANLLTEAIDTNAEAIKSAGEATTSNTEALDRELERQKELQITRAEKLKSLEDENQAIDANTDSVKASIEATERNSKAQQFFIALDEEIAESLERIAELRSKGLELGKQEIDLDTEKGTLAQNLIELQKAGAEEIADLGLVTVAAFQSAVEASGSYIEAVKQTGPALQAVVDAQTALGVSSDNIALEELAHFQARIADNEALVRATEALDDTMLALSATGSLNAETMGAMERQGLRMFNKLVEAGFTEQQSLLMIQDFLSTTMEAHEKLGIPIDENTQKLIDQAKEAGALETKQKAGWKVVEEAIIKVVDKLQEMIDKILGVNQEIRKIPKKIQTEIAVRTHSSGPYASKASMYLDTGEWDVTELQHGGIVTQPTLGMVGEAGPEAVIPLSEMSNEDLLDELKGVRSELRLLPLHLRDAILLAQ